MTYQEYLQGGVYDGDQVETFVSPHIKGLLGYTQEEWRRPGFWRQATHPDDLALIDAESDRVIAAGERNYRQDYRMVSKDGQVVWFHDESVLIDDADGEPLLWQGVMIDITDRKDAEHQLAQAEERFRLLVERSPAIVYMELPSEGLEAGSVAYVSPQISSLLGVPQEAWQEPGAWAAMMHPDDRDRIVNDGTAARVAGEPWVAEYRMIAADGRVVWFHDESVLVLDERGEPSMWQGIMVDITDQKAAEQRVREAEERHRALVEHIPAIVYAEGLDASPEDPLPESAGGTDPGIHPDQWRRTADFWKLHIHPDDLAGVLEINDRVNESPRDLPRRIPVPAAGRVRPWLRDEAVRVHDDRPAVVLAGRALDITTRSVASRTCERPRSATAPSSNTSRRSSTPSRPTPIPPSSTSAPRSRICSATPPRSGPGPPTSGATASTRTTRRRSSPQTAVQRDAGGLHAGLPLPAPGRPLGVGP